MKEADILREKLLEFDTEIQECVLGFLKCYKGEYPIIFNKEYQGGNTFDKTTYITYIKEIRVRKMIFYYLIDSKLLTHENGISANFNMGDREIPIKQLTGIINVKILKDLQKL